MGPGSRFARPGRQRSFRADGRLRDTRSSYRVAVAGGTSGSSGGCGPITLVSARWAQISSLHSGSAGAEPPTPTAPTNWLPLTRIGSAPELGKLPNDIWRASDERPVNT